jgi:hypothetical protein
MQSQKITLGKKLFLQKETVAVMNGDPQTDVVKGPFAMSAPYHTALSLDSPLRCWPCCMEPNTVGSRCN